MLSNDKSTWLTYLDKMRSETSENEYKKILTLDGFFFTAFNKNLFLRNNTPYTYILDYKTNRYLNMTDNFAGYESECFTKYGVDHTREILHAKHLQLLNREIFPDRLNILSGIYPDEHQNYIFSYTLVIRNSDGEYCKVLQKNCFISDENGNPLFSMGILSYITDFHFDNRVIQTVHKIGQNGQQEFQDHLKKIYFLNEEDKLFSKREREVLYLMSDGLSNKMIGDKLCIAEKTVKNHRSNMQDKTGTTNGIALVTFAHRAGLI